MQLTTKDEWVEARLKVLGLARELGNVRLACECARISRSHFYRLKKAFEAYGAAGLAPRPRRLPAMPNQTPPELARCILEMTERFPTYSYPRIGERLRVIGVKASDSTVRAVWQRHGLTLRRSRLMWLGEKGDALNGRQVTLLSRALKVGQ